MTLEYWEVMDDVYKEKTKTAEEIAEIKHKAKIISRDQENVEKKEDKVNHPSHYTWLKKLCGIEVIDITRHMCFNLGNVVKYVLRAGHKSEEGYSDEDKELEDLRKAKWYLEDEISLRSGVKITDIDIIKHHEKTIEELQDQIAILSEANKHLRVVSILGEMKLRKNEILQAAEIVKNTEYIDNILVFKQSSGGIGIGTELSYTKNNGKETNSVDITDYDCW